MSIAVIQRNAPASPAQDLRPLDVSEIERRLGQCSPLPSLTRNLHEMLALLDAKQSYSDQICEIIRRDPSLTSRVLRLVNSVYYGLARPVKSIEEAVFYVGIEQVRNLATVTPVIEDFHKLVGRTHFPWARFWQHCIGTAIMTREVVAAMLATPEEVDYVAGLVHDVGVIVMAAGFPDHFHEIHRRQRETPQALSVLEKEVLGFNHAELGAIYLGRLNLPAVLVEAARWHEQPSSAKHEPAIVAAVQIANLLIRGAKIGYCGESLPGSPEQCLQAEGWDILFPHQNIDARNLALSSLQGALQRLPTQLQSMSIV